MCFNFGVFYVMGVNRASSSSVHTFFFYIQTVQTRSLIPQAQANDVLYTYKRMSAISVTMFLLHLNR